MDAAARQPPRRAARVQEPDQALSAVGLVRVAVKSEWVVVGGVVLVLMVLAVGAAWLTNSVYMPRAHCVKAEPFVVWGSVLSDSITALAYYTIPAGLLVAWARASDHGFPLWVAVAFAAFIVACGTVHLVEVWMFWLPTYRVSTVVKMVTALISIAVAIAWWVEIVPRLRKGLPSE